MFSSKILPQAVSMDDVNNSSELHAHWYIFALFLIKYQSMFLIKYQSMANIWYKMLNYWVLSISNLICQLIEQYKWAATTTFIIIIQMTD